MVPHVELSDSDYELLATLTSKTRVLAEQQAARAYYANAKDPFRYAARRLQRLEEAGLVSRLTTMARPELPLTGPLFTWQPGGPEPDLSHLARLLSDRWCDPPQTTTFVFATRAACCRFGGCNGSRPPRLSETTHDLHLAGVYLWYQKNRPAIAKRWVSEAQLHQEGWGRNGRLPDALLRRSLTDQGLIVEFGGSYSHAKLREFHNFFRQRPYEIW